ncbi:MAG: hypothetical protein E3J72_10190 [Planctomycetota bacterium]|nr:MAG: hypothetical protein E3J72_10190 [Planctomycetota bacterium]
MSKRKIIALAILMILGLVFLTEGCGSSHKSGRSSSSGGGGGSTGGGGGGTGGGGTGGGGTGNVSLPFGGSSNGTGGKSGTQSLTTSSGVSYNLIVPGSYSENSPNEFLIVYSGTEGAAQMTQNLGNFAPKSFIIACLDGPTYRGNGKAGSDVLDEVRAAYNIDNDRTYLMGESAGTGGAASLGFNLRQDCFAAYWANDITSEISSYSPAKTASELGFEPWGNVGPGGKVSIAEQIVQLMRDAGYRLPDDAPYSGAGSGTHGDPNQFRAALSFFPGKTRQ